MTSTAGVAVADFGLLRALSVGGFAGLVAGVADGEVSGPVGSVVALLDGVDPYRLQDGQRVDLIRAWERVAAVVAGAQVRALAAVVEATEARGLDGEFARHEVGAALRLSAPTAWKRTRDAADLVHRLPATLGELSAGRISGLQAAHLAEAVRELPDEVAAAVEARVLA